MDRRSKCGVQEAIAHKLSVSQTVNKYTHVLPLPWTNNSIQLCLMVSMMIELFVWSFI